jgi:opacity protein-like surface antigen
MLRMTVRVSGFVLAVALIAAPASAQIVQSLQISGGAFIPQGYSGRVSGDVLVKDLDSLDFTKCTSTNFQSCIRVFNGGQLSGEWLVAFGNHVELGAGVGFYSRSTPSVYLNYGKPDGSDIVQNLNLRIVPVTAVVRFLAGRPGRFQPYVGAGVAALNFRYTEDGEFIDFTDPNANPLPTYSARYTARGTAVGPLALAGLRIPVGGDVWGITFEWRHQWGSGNTGGPSNGFLDNKIDLGGDNVSFGVLVRF